MIGNVIPKYVFAKCVVASSKIRRQVETGILKFFRDSDIWAVKKSLEGVRVSLVPETGKFRETEGFFASSTYTE